MLVNAVSKAATVGLAFLPSHAQTGLAPAFAAFARTTADRTNGTASQHRLSGWNSDQYLAALGSFLFLF